MLIVAIKMSGDKINIDSGDLLLGSGDNSRERR